MKITNLTKLIIRFLGGGKIDFPTSNLREVEIEPFDGGASDDDNNKIYFPYWSKPVGFVLSYDFFHSNIEYDDNSGEVLVNDDNIVVYPLEDLTPEFVKTHGTYDETVLARVVEAWYELEILLLYEYAERTDEYGLEPDSLGISPAVSIYNAYIYLDVDNGNVDENVITSFNLEQVSGSAGVQTVVINGKKYLTSTNFG